MTAASPDLIFGKYEIQARLAIGGMGEVFFAVQRGVQGFERPAILKNLLPDLAQQEGFVEQFLDEARVAATLNHPNVVSIHEVGLWNGTYFIAMEYIHGRNISQMMRAAAKAQVLVTPLVAAQVIRDAALGLDHAHHAVDAAGKPLNIVHRDISPQNIMVREDGVTKVVDFGIARAANRATRTQTGNVKGKLAYMPPEQLLASSTITAHADQYALGIVLWEMCAGRRLFRADSESALVRLVIDAKVPPLAEVAPGMPEPLVDVVQRMLARLPGDRFADCAEAARALDLCISSLSPPGRGSPVSSFVRTLGPVELPTTMATPSNEKNFVISLSGGKPAMPPPMPQDGTDVVLTPSGLEVTPRRRTPLLAGAAVVVALGLLGVLWAVRPAKGTMRIEAQPACVLSIDGQAVSPEPLASRTLELDVGEHVVECTLGAEPGPKAQTITVRAGEVARVTFDLRPQPSNAPAPIPPAVENAAPMVKTATWTLTSAPPGASVRLDGRAVGQTPLELKLSAGEPHFLSVEHAGFRRDERELQALAGGDTRPLMVSLVALKVAAVAAPVAASAPTAQGPGFLTLKTTPWTKVSEGGDLLGSTPLFKVKLKPGEHTLTLVNEGQNVNQTRRITIRSGELTKLDVSL